VLVVSTLLMAALFNPLRVRVQDFIDRRFYRQKYNAEQALASFTTNLRQEIDLDDIILNFQTVAAESMQPEHISLWLKEPRK
jgi:phage gp46-like protein